MKVKIIKCASDEYWYKDEIGKEFIVNFPIQDCYKVFAMGASYCVLKSDVKIINN